MKMAALCGVKFLISSLLFIFLSVNVDSHPSTFRAAVYEHLPSLQRNPFRMLPRRQALQFMQRNLRVYRDKAKKAKQQGAQIIVFPEDGIYGLTFSRKSLVPFLEQIANPEVVHWSPCSDPYRFPDTEVQKALSCMAKENGIYLVANMGDYVPCDSWEDARCPSDGHYQFNTDVAYGPDGTLLAKYHKTHLFFESQFDAAKPKIAFFDTPFGRFGMVTCFDLVFNDPVMTMLKEHGVNNIAFPTAWMDGLPLLTSIGYQSSFARGLGINFLAANVHIPKFNFHGSGIYTPKGMADFYYNENLLSPGKLMVSEIDILQSNNISRIAPSGNHLNTKTIKKDEFKSKLFHDQFTFHLLDKQSGEINVCQGHVCCSLNYTTSDDFQSLRDTFAFGVFDGFHTNHARYYLQICALIKCAKKNDRTTCGSKTKTSSTKFKSFSMSGRFQTGFVYPQVIMSSSGQLVLGNQSSWSFQENTLKAGPGLDKPLLSAALFGRYYSRDNDSS